TTVVLWRRRFVIPPSLIRPPMSRLRPALSQTVTTPRWLHNQIVARFHETATRQAGCDASEAEAYCFPDALSFSCDVSNSSVSGNTSNRSSAFVITVRYRPLTPSRLIALHTVLVLTFASRARARADNRLRSIARRSACPSRCI